MSREISIKDVKIGGANPIVLIAGPCVIESAKAALRHARLIKSITKSLGVPFIYKSSYDKANRTSIKSFRGPGLKKGLDILKAVKEKAGIPVLSDVHCVREVAQASKVLDVIQIPAFLCRQTDLIVEAASTGRAVNVKKGQFLAPWDMGQVIKKIESAGNRKILLTERGVMFGYNNLVSDFRSLLIMKDFGYPVIYDATHSVQMPGGLGDKSGGESRFIPYLALAAATCGADAIFLEAHEDPASSPSDAANMIKLSDLEKLLIKLKKVERAAR